MRILETPRLLLRHQELADLDSLYALYCDPDVRRFIPDAPTTRNGTKAELEWHMHGHRHRPELGLWATVHKANGAFIGRCGLLPWVLDGREEIEVAFLLAKAYWGQGLGTEVAQAIVQHAFEKLQLTRLVCLIEPENHASMRVAEHIGMTFEKDMVDALGPFKLYGMHSVADS